MKPIVSINAMMMEPTTTTDNTKTDQDDTAGINSKITNANNISKVILLSLIHIHTG
jgi:hypothetical protein